MEAAKDVVFPSRVLKRQLDNAQQRLREMEEELDFIRTQERKRKKKRVSLHCPHHTQFSSLRVFKEVLTHEGWLNTSRVSFRGGGGSICPPPLKPSCPPLENFLNETLTSISLVIKGRKI